MQIWLEIIGSFPERAGKYLICPIHSSTKQNYFLYKIMEEPRPGDFVFHYVLEKAYSKAVKKPSAFNSYSIVEDRFHIVGEKDPLCSYPPPYRVINLYDHTYLKIPITMELLRPHRRELESMSKRAGFSRSPFDKNFNIKQLYLSRIPLEYMPLFTKLSKTNIPL